MKNPTPRIPPHSIEAEQAVLGSLLLGMGRQTLLEDLKGLTKTDFYREAHGEIYDAARALMARSEPVDIVTLKDELTRRRLLEQCGGYLYLMQLAETVPSIATLPHYAGIVREKAVLRSLIEVASEAAGMAYLENPSEDILTQVEKVTRSLREYGRKGPGDIRILRDLVADELDRVESRYMRRMEGGECLDGIPTGIPDLDMILTGLKPGEFTIIAARPAMGKSALAANIIRACAQSGSSVLLASLEMGESQTAQRFLAMEAKLDSYALRIGALENSDWHELQRAMNALWDYPVFVTTCSVLTPSLLASRARSVEGLGLLVVDYLQLMSGEGGDNRREEIDSISRALKNLAVELQIPVVALAQLSRACEARQDKRPILSDLRESGGLEQDTDNVIMLYRPSYYANTPPDGWKPDKIEILVRKNRMLGPGIAIAGFIGAQTLFVPWVDPEEFPTEEIPDEALPPWARK